MALRLHSPLRGQRGTGFGKKAGVGCWRAAPAKQASDVPPTGLLRRIAWPARIVVPATAGNAVALDDGLGLPIQAVCPRAGDQQGRDGGLHAAGSSCGSSVHAGDGSRSAPPAP